MLRSARSVRSDMFEHELCANPQFACSSLSIRKEHASSSRHGFRARACGVGCVSGRVHRVYSLRLDADRLRDQPPASVCGGHLQHLRGRVCVRPIEVPLRDLGDRRNAVQHVALCLVALMELSLQGTLRLCLNSCHCRDGLCVAAECLSI